MTTKSAVRYMSIKTIRDRFEIGRWAAYRLVEQDGFPVPLIVGQEYRYPEDEVYAFVANRRQSASSEIAARRRRTHATAIVVTGADPVLEWA